MRSITLLSAVAAMAIAIPAGTVAGGDADERSATDRAARNTDVVRQRDIEPLRLRCGVRTTDVVALDVATDSASGTPVVQCEWSAPTSPHAAGVRLVRLDPAVDDHRRIVFRTHDLHVTTYTDTKIRRGHRYAYAVQAVSATGPVVGQSETVWVRIPRATDVEVLRLECRLGPAGEAIGCEWSRPRHRDAAAITLWRSVDGGPREIVERFRPAGPNAYRDPVPPRASKVTYAVIATTPDDRIVARSRPETVRIPDRVPTRAEVARL